MYYGQYGNGECPFLVFCVSFGFSTVLNSYSDKLVNYFTNSGLKFLSIA